MSPLYAALVDLAAARKERNEAVNDTRHPYTYACDYLRTKVGAHISRAEMSQIRSLIAEALGLDDAYVAEALAKQYHKLNGDDYRRCATDALYRAEQQT